MPARGLAAPCWAICGVLAVELLPRALVPFPAARAAWCWEASPPKCDAPVVSGGSCEEGATIPAGDLCTPVCSAGLVANCPGSRAVRCPPSHPASGCIGDIGPTGWWGPCGYGNVCLRNIQMGSAPYMSFGTFECVTPASASHPCSPAAAPPPAEAPWNPGPTWDAATLGFIVGLSVLLAAAAIFVRLPMQGAKLLLFRPGPMAWTAANGIGVLLVVGGLIVFSMSLALGRTSTEAVFVLGLASGLASCLPIWWACYLAGAHSVVRMSREAAWRVHIAFGALALGLASAHGAQALADESIDVFGNAFFALGFVGLLFMYLGVLPALLHLLKVVTYDVWKMLHFMSLLGYLLSIVHMLDHALKFKTARSIAVLAMNMLALLVFLVQKIYVKRTPDAFVKDAQVIEEQCGRHIRLCLAARGFAPTPGQWGYLSVPWLSPVPHPFTVVPAAERDAVQLFIKVSGRFTGRLASACRNGPENAPAMSLEGPYGEPPLPSPHVEGVAFVLGGVGVTPALSLLAEARKTCGERVGVYWALRSPGLLRWCAPLLEGSLNERISCIRLSDCPSEDARLPLGAQAGRGDVGEWLANTADDFSNQGVQVGLLFVCGPPSLASAAKAAARRTSGMKWHLHVEQFRFLPQLPCFDGSEHRRGARSKSIEPQGSGSSGSSSGCSSRSNTME